MPSCPCSKKVAPEGMDDIVRDRKCTDKEANEKRGEMKAGAHLQEFVANNKKADAKEGESRPAEETKSGGGKKKKGAQKKKKAASKQKKVKKRKMMKKPFSFKNISLNIYILSM